jgi:hypothetical protein
MAKIITLQVLVDMPDDETIEQCLVATFAKAMREDDSIVDYRLKDTYGDNEMYASPIPAEIEDAICNGTYSPGDAFRSGSFVLPTGKDYEFGPNDSAQRDCIDSVWITVPPPAPLSDLPEGVTGNLSVYVRRTHEGVIVDVWAHGAEDGGSIDSLGVEYSDAAAIQEEYLRPAA